MTLNVGAGLYVLRYLSSANPRSAPEAYVSPGAGSLSDIDVIVAPGLTPGTMSGPGSNIVLVVRRPGSVEVAVRAIEGSSNVDAKLSLDMLAGAATPAQSASIGMTNLRANEGRARHVQGDDLPALMIEAHVARRGDVTPDRDGWIAGPAAPSAIEGIVVRSSDAGVGIAVQFRNTIDRSWSRWLNPGDFIGTVQKASPLTALRLKLVGPKAQFFELHVQSLFLGSPIQDRRSSEVELMSPGDLDPLVGLKIELLALSQVSNAPEQKQARVRVFR